MRLLFGRSRKKSLSYYFIVIVLAFGIWIFNAESTQTQLQQTPPGTYQVVSVSDGDTITVLMSGEEQTIRFIGVDTPETHHPQKPVQCFGQAASNFTTELIGDNNVRLEADPESDNRDIYNRLLRYVYLPDGTNVNAEIVAQGYGFAPVTYAHGKLEEFKQLETTARTQQRGLWAGCDIEVNQYGSEETQAAGGTEDGR